MRKPLLVLISTSILTLTGCSSVSFDFGFVSSMHQPSTSESTLETTSEISSETSSNEESSADHKHDYTMIDYAPKCEEQGYTLYICDICGYTKKDDFIDALGHDWSALTQISAGDCQNKSQSKHTCSRCNKVETVEGELGSHDYERVDVGPTCTEAGYQARKCTVCGDELDRMEGSPASGHTYGDWIVTEYPTTTKEGSHYKVCSTCGDKQVEAMPVLEEETPDYDSMQTIELNSENSSSLPTQYKDGNYAQTYIGSISYKQYRTYGLSASSKFIKLISADFTSYVNLPEAQLGGTFSNSTPIKGIKKIEMSYSTTADAKIYYGSSINLTNYVNVSSSKSTGTFEFGENDINYFRITSGTADVSIDSIKIYYLDSGTVDSGAYGSCGQGLWRLNPKTVSGTPENGDTVECPIKATKSGSTYTVQEKKTYTYYTYEYIVEHPELSGAASWIDPIDVANYFCSFKTYPANYVSKSNFLTAKEYFGDSTRCVSQYSRTNGYAQAVPYKGTPTYYECDIALNSSYSQNNRSVGRVIAWATGFDSSKGATGYDTNPVCVFTDDHYSTFQEYYNNGTWGRRYNAIYSDSVGQTMVTNYVYGAPTTL